jgi:hypothetical protein
VAGHIEAGSSLALGLQGGVATSGPQVEAGGVEHARVVERELALQARPRRVGVGLVGGAAATSGRRGGPPSLERWPSGPPPAASAPACPLRGIASDGDRSWEGEDGAMGSGAEGEDVRGVGGGAEPCTVNVYTIVLSSSRD